MASYPGPAIADPFGLGGGPPAPTPPTPGSGSAQMSPLASAASNGATTSTDSSATSQSSAGQNTAQDTTAPPTTVGGYDLSTDPILQMTQAAVARQDAAAQSAALTAQQQALLNYGDPALAAAVLGANDPYAAAAGQNQESTLSLLARQHGLQEQDFTAGLDPSLAFSGYRINQEGQLGQAYQDALYQAAQAIQGQLSGITGTENATLSADQIEEQNAISDAYSRAVANAIANPPAPPVLPPPDPGYVLPTGGYRWPGPPVAS